MDLKFPTECHKFPLWPQFWDLPLERIGPFTQQDISPLTWQRRRARREDGLRSGEFKDCSSIPEGPSEGLKEREPWKLGLQLSGLSLLAARTVNPGLWVLTAKGPWISVFKAFIVLLRKQVHRGNEVGHRPKLLL